jgi:hypothetical protein
MANCSTVYLFGLIVAIHRSGSMRQIPPSGGTILYRTVSFEAPGFPEAVTSGEPGAVGRGGGSETRLPSTGRGIVYCFTKAGGLMSYQHHPADVIQRLARSCTCWYLTRRPRHAPRPSRHGAGGCADRGGVRTTPLPLERADGPTRPAPRPRKGRAPPSADARLRG